jgi:hypothetical protein
MLPALKLYSRHHFQALKNNTETKSEKLQADKTSVLKCSVI